MLFLCVLLAIALASMPDTVLSGTALCNAAGPGMVPRDAALSESVVPVTLLTGFGASERLWRWPVDGSPQVVRRFDPPPEPWLAGHRGVDLTGTDGAVVVAAGPGVVRFAGLVVDRPLVSITHADGLVTAYEPVTPLVAQGDPVVAGQPIGLLLPGHSGCAAACLHWSLRRGRTYLDPLALLGSGRVRLLPDLASRPFPPAARGQLWARSIETRLAGGTLGLHCPSSIRGGRIMALRFLGKDPNSESTNSPTIWDDGEEYVIQGWRVTDLADLAVIGDVPVHETVVRIPKRMMPFFPEVNGGGATPLA